MESVRFWLAMMSHLNDLNVKLQREKHITLYFITAILAFQKKLEIFNITFKANLNIFRDFLGK